MSDYIFIRKSRNAFSSLLHIILNILLGVGSIFATIITGNWIPGLVLVLLSKWRVFAVRPHYWAVNVKANLVDFIVGVSLVFISYCYGTTIMPIHLLLSIFYIVWLLFIKPRSDEIATAAQALTAIFLGTTASVLMSANADAIFLGIAGFLIGYSAARHIVVQRDDTRHTSLLVLLCGLVFAEITWLAHHWLIIYSFSGSGILIPQVAIILSLFSFLFGRFYHSALKHDGKIKAQEIYLPTIFCMLIVAILFLWFSKPIFNI